MTPDSTILEKPTQSTAPAVIDRTTPSTDLASAPDGLPALDDAGTAGELSRIANALGEALVVVNGYTACLYARSSPTATWVQVCCGEFGDEALAAAKRFVQRGLWWAATSGAPWVVDPSSLPLTKASAKDMRRWVHASNDETSGREGDVTQAIKDELTYLAGWRCQFAGCGRDLKRHGATGGRGRFSYFAHIVAASPKGPRGHSTESKRLASELSNFMLLCDECHRLVDKVNPARYTVPVLRKMREDSIAEVQRLLDTLQYPATEVIAIIGNAAGQQGQLSVDDARQALWGRQLRCVSTKPEYFFRLGGNNHQVHEATYWMSMFQSLRQEIPLLQALLNGTRHGGGPRPRLAVFPLHGTSVLLLAGRLFGDNAGTHLFQPHRNLVGDGTRWEWPAEDGAAASHKFEVTQMAPPAAEVTEACLVVALTSDIPPERMPAACAANGRHRLPTLRITGPTFDKACMQHPADVQLFGRAVDAAICRLQDEWHVSKVHLFVSAPATAVVTVGQKMQARHHASFVCYEALPGAGSAYAATIEISSASVRELVSGNDASFNLQL